MFPKLRGRVVQINIGTISFLDRESLDRENEGSAAVLFDITAMERKNYF